jgi:arylsulfatase A-like enzyme
MKQSFSLLLLFGWLAMSAWAEPTAPSRQVLVVVFDGMRPDFISEQRTPHLWGLTKEGVFFAHHHPVFLSSTEVNGTAIATGLYPSHSYVIANVDFRPLIDPQNTVGIEVPETVRRGDRISGGHYLGGATLAEILRSHGVKTAIAGSKQVALLHDRAARDTTPEGFAVMYEGASQPVAVAEAVIKSLGSFPPISKTNDKQARDVWTTQALIETLWKKDIPPFSLLWLAEPDFSQHATGPGSEQSLASIENSDRQLGLVLDELERRGLRASTDVLVVSDHGFSTISRKTDIAVELSKAGFDAKRVAPGGLQKGAVLVAANGGSSLLYVGDHDPEVSRRLIDFLQHQDWTGVIFSREAAEGTFPLSEARIDSPQAPDVVVSLRWTDGKSANGTPGLQTSDLSASSDRVGNHASLSSYDMHNTLVAAGPDFRRGVVNTLPSANTDIAPTVLWLLGFHDEVSKMDGRVLGEALATEAPPLRSYEIKQLAAERGLDALKWKQYLRISEVNGVRYLDEGNGEQIRP